MKKIVMFGCLLAFVGAYVAGCSDEKEPVGANIHPDGWSEKGSGDFHGTALLTKSLSLEGCQSCHGTAYEGGSSGVSCYASGCHNNYPHPDGFADPNDADSHANLIAETLNWNILDCQSCHGAAYDGVGFQAKNCLTCHKEADGPEDCRLCHGNAESPAPPRDLSGNTKTTATGVGAHQIHLTGTTWTRVMEGQCRTCHQPVGNYAADGHVDDGTPHSEIIFNALATFEDGDGAVWSRMDASCSNVYCHGNFEFRQDESNYPWAYADSVMTGNNQAVFWKYVGAGQALCGTCHGLPPTGHISAALNSCGGCHGSVVDENLNIVNKFLHINGKVDVFN